MDKNFGSGTHASRLPQPLPRPHNVPEPQDRPYPGIIKLSVDASDVLRRILHVHEIVPVSKPGRFTLLYPEWLPGFHSPQAPIDLMAGLSVAAQGRHISWRRDPVNIYAFHLDVPQGVRELDIRFQYLAPTDAGQNRITVTPEIIDLQWNTVVLHPAGYFARNIIVEARARLPRGWGHACAVRQQKREADAVILEQAPLDVLVDSPLYAGRHMRSIALEDNVSLNLFADRPEYNSIDESLVRVCRNLVQEARKLFGAEHYDHYDFLVALSAEIGSNGIEHHRSCEIATKPDLFTSWDKNLTKRDVLAHEFIHSWNGKYRRGADSWQPCFHLPIQNSLMWVYEGLTQYLGQVLCARAGIWTKDDLIQSLACVAGDQLNMRGRTWRSMQDTTRDPIITERNPIPWTSWQRKEDYYSDGQLMWLEIDMLIRTRSGHKKSLDDFARIFFGMNDGEWITNTYHFEDVCAALNDVLPFDWTQYFEDRLNGLSPDPPLDGIALGGYRLEYHPTPNHFAEKQNALAGTVDLTHSLGLRLKQDGKVSECIWNSPAFEAGMTAGCRILAVDGRKFSTDEMQLAVARTSEGCFPEITYQTGNHILQQKLRYADGPRYPHLFATATDPVLDRIARSA